MRGIRICLIAAVALGVAGVTGAAGPMALNKDGDLFIASKGDNQIIVSARYADGTVGEFAVPQSAAAVESSLQVGVDDATGAIYVLWQKLNGMDAKLRIAGFLDGTWIGPKTFAGNDGTAAYNPVMLIHRATSIIEEGAGEGEEPTTVEVATSFLHLAWWSQFSEDDPGFAKYAAVELHSNGVPQFRDMVEVDLTDLLPYGFACFEFEESENLRHPKLFIDPQTGNPHIFATDIANCLFQIIEIIPVLEEEMQGFEKRRRQIIILRQAAMIALRADLPMASAKMAIGSGLKIIMHWDGAEENHLQYLELDVEGISETKTLVLDEDINHEQAVELIRELTH